MKRNLLKRIFDHALPISLFWIIELGGVNIGSYYANRAAMQILEDRKGVDEAVCYAKTKNYKERKKDSLLRPFIGTLGARKAWTEYIEMNE